MRDDWSLVCDPEDEALFRCENVGEAFWHTGPYAPVSQDSSASRPRPLRDIEKCRPSFADFFARSMNLARPRLDRRWCSFDPSAKDVSSDAPACPNRHEEMRSASGTGRRITATYRKSFGGQWMRAGRVHEILIAPMSCSVAGSSKVITGNTLTLHASDRDTSASSPARNSE